MFLDLPEEFTIKVHPTHDNDGEIWHCAHLSVPEGTHIIGSVVGISVWRREQRDAVRAVMQAVSERLSEETIRTVVKQSREFVEKCKRT
jgi:hypothetical protein